jgi:hypothetical protein
MSNDNRGLASADEKTKNRVASEGGKAPHDERGLEAADEETRKRVAREVEKHLAVAVEIKNNNSKKMIINQFEVNKSHFFKRSY